MFCRQWNATAASSTAKGLDCQMTTRLHAFNTTSPFRVLISGALHLMPAIDALVADGAEIIASDRDAVALAAALDGRASVRALPADLDLTLDAHRLAVALQRAGGCDAFVHHMGGSAQDADATVFLRAIHLVHALRPQMRRGLRAPLILTGCPAGCARSLGIVLDRAGTFCTGTGPAIIRCAPDEVLPLLHARWQSIAADRAGIEAVALAG